MSRRADDEDDGEAETVWERERLEEIKERDFAFFLSWDDCLEGFFGKVVVEAGESGASLCGHGSCASCLRFDTEKPFSPKPVGAAPGAGGGGGGGGWSGGRPAATTE